MEKYICDRVRQFHWLLDQVDEGLAYMYLLDDIWDFVNLVKRVYEYIITMQAFFSLQENYIIADTNSLWVPMLKAKDI